MQASEISAAAKQGGRVGVLLIHGLCGSPSEIRFVANGLTRSGYTVLCPELAGHGGTEADLMATTWQDWYASAEKGLEQLAATCDTVIVGGLSTGAVLSLLLAARHPDKVHAVALYSPTLWLSGRQVPWYLPLVRLFANKWFANFFRFPVPLHVGIKDQRVREFIRNAMAGQGGKAAPLSTPGGAVMERRMLAKVVMKKLRAIAQPVLILHAREDDYAGLDNAAYLQRELSGPVDLVVLDDSYHMVTIDRQRDVVLDRTSTFVARIAGSLAGRMRGKAAAQLAVVAPMSPAAA